MSLRDELLIPFRGVHWTAPFTGSAVLLRWITQLLHLAYRATRRTTGRDKPTQPLPPFLARKRDTNTPTPGPAAPLDQLADEVGNGAQDPVGATKTQGTAAAGKAQVVKATASGAERLERAGIALLIGLVAFAALSGPLKLLYASVAPYAPTTLSILAAAWLVTATAVAPPRNTTTQNDHENSAGEQHEEAAQPPAEDIRTLRTILTGIQEATTAGRRGIHLATLAPRIDPNWDVTTLRTHCDRLNIPYKKINIRGTGSTWGVHVTDLETALNTPLEDALSHPAEDLLTALSKPPATPTVGATHAPTTTTDNRAASTPTQATHEGPLTRLVPAASAPSPNDAP